MSLACACGQCIGAGTALELLHCVFDAPVWHGASTRARARQAPGAARFELGHHGTRRCHLDARCEVDLDEVKR